MPSIILASSSPRRRELLTGLGLRFEARPSDFDESSIAESDPARLVEQLALHKAQTVLDEVRHQHRHPVVIGADTVVVIDGEILGKPRNPADAHDMLRKLQGRTHAVYTGLCVMGLMSETVERRVRHERTDVTMQALGDAQIHSYVATGEPLDKAGAYAIQGLGATLVSGIQGDYFTVVGLPLHVLSSVLAEFGIDIMTAQA